MEASASTFYREMKKAELMGKSQKRSRAPQVKPEVKADRSNQVWSWDLTYISLGSFFVYLFAIIDVYSRKIVGWYLSPQTTVKAMKVAWDRALSKERLLRRWEVPCFPLALSDHGVQMAKEFLETWASSNSLLAIRCLKTIVGLNPGFKSSSTTGSGLKIT